MALLNRFAQHVCSRTGLHSPALSCKARWFATREGASTEEEYGKETDDNIAPPKGAQDLPGHDLDKKATPEGPSPSGDETSEQRQEANNPTGHQKENNPDTQYPSDIPRPPDGPSGRADDPHQS